ncbi:hypothetical protein [Microbispora sp. NPDC046933]|uniref:hypothetical protein n=1 Tax=Microbispora sp. NPDC046933 TaxID=3155618 RepID=UPI003411C167
MDRYDVHPGVVEAGIGQAQRRRAQRPRRDVDPRRVHPADGTEYIITGPPPTDNRDSFPDFVFITVFSWLLLLVLAIFSNMLMAKRSAISSRT